MRRCLALVARPAVQGAVMAATRWTGPRQAPSTVRTCWPALGRRHMGTDPPPNPAPAATGDAGAATDPVGHADSRHLSDVARVMAAGVVVAQGTALFLYPPLAEAALQTEDPGALVSVLGGLALFAVLDKQIRRAMESDSGRAHAVAYFANQLRWGAGLWLGTQAIVYTSPLVCVVRRGRGAPSPVVYAGGFLPAAGSPRTAR